MIMANVTSITEYKYSQEFTYGIVICLGLAAFVGFVGNVLLVVIITQARKLRSVMNRFILHLAIGDLIVCAICIPLFLAINFYPEKSNTVVMCKTARFLQYLAPQGTIMLLITIGINRHQAIVHPLRGMTYSTANKLIFGAWLYSLIVVAPSIYLTNVQYYTIPHLNTTKSNVQYSTIPHLNTTKSYCATIPVSTKLGLSYVLGLAFFGYIIPLITLLVLYSKISHSVWRRNVGNSSEIRTSRPATATLKSRKKVIKMFLTVILVFVITWLPLIIYVGALESYLGGPKRISYVRLTLYSIGLSNSIYNPFIYSFFNKRFREGCKSLFKGSARIVTRKSAERREAIRKKNKSYVVKTDFGTTNVEKDPDQDWRKKFSARALREHSDNNACESKDNVNLLTIKEIVPCEQQTDSTSQLIDSENQSLSNLGQPSTNKELPVFKNDYYSPSGSLRRHSNPTGRKKKTAYKTLSINSSLNSRQNSEIIKLRKTLSLDETLQWSNDFENIF